MNQNKKTKVIALGFILALQGCTVLKSKERTEESLKITKPSDTYIKKMTSTGWKQKPCEKVRDSATEYAKLMIPAKNPKCLEKIFQDYSENEGTGFKVTSPITLVMIEDKSKSTLTYELLSLKGSEQGLKTATKEIQDLFKKD